MSIALHIQHWLRHVTPALSALLLVLLSSVNFYIEGLGSFIPMVGIIAIYYWAMYLPSLLPLWFVFLLGVLQDFLHGTPVGMSSLLFLLFLKFLHMQRRYLAREDFWVFWLVFCFLSLFYALVSGMAYSLYYQSIMINDSLFMQWMYTVLIYPFLHLCFANIQVKLLNISV